MNYYIDFDNTLYNTPKLTERLIQSIVLYVSNQKKEINKNTIHSDCISNFNKDHIYNIYDLAKYIASKYELSSSPIINNLSSIILNSRDLVYSDVAPFLNKLKQNNNKIYILSFGRKSMQYQTAKISGSGLSELFDAIYITSTYKFDLDINYQNGIFIDDNPRDLLGLYKKNAHQVIRLRRIENKYSAEDIKNTNIKEYSDLSQIPIIKEEAI